MNSFTKMHCAPQAERLDFYRYSLAAESWSEALNTLKRIQEMELNPNQETKAITYELRIAFFTLYGRPFKQRAALRIDSKIIPSELKQVHDAIILLRDKMFSHSDQDLVSSVGDPINRVIIEVRPRSLSIGVTSLRPLKKSAETYIELLNQIIKTTVYRRDKIFKNGKDTFAYLLERSGRSI